MIERLPCAGPFTQRTPSLHPPFMAGETEICPSAYFWPEVSLELEGSSVYRRPQLLSVLGGVCQVR